MELAEKILIAMIVTIIGSLIIIVVACIISGVTCYQRYGSFSCPTVVHYEYDIQFGK